MSDREKVLQGLEYCRSLNPPDGCPKECPYSVESNQYRCCLFDPLLNDAIAVLKEQEALVTRLRRSWKMIKFSVMDTANNNAGPDGNEDVYRILTWVTTIMDQQEALWND